MTITNLFFLLKNQRWDNIIEAGMSNYDILAKKRTSTDGGSQSSSRTRVDSPRFNTTTSKTDPPKTATPKVDPPKAATPKSKPAAKQETVEMTQDEVVKKLTGYMPIPKRHWEDLSRGDHVRWIERDGKFGKGGYFKFYYQDKEDPQKRYIQVESIFGGKRGDQFYTTYNVELGDLQALYRKPTLDYYMARANFMSEIEKLRNEIRLLRGGK